VVGDMWQDIDLIRADLRRLCDVGLEIRYGIGYDELRMLGVMEAGVGCVRPLSLGKEPRWRGTRRRIICSSLLV